MTLPCVRQNELGLRWFQLTADQRFLLGEQAFDKTHVPMHLWQQRTGKQLTLSEGAFLDVLLAPPVNLIGNRGFFLYGAAGTGKSELMRWLKVRLGQAGRTVIRVSRTDLDPVRLMAHMLEVCNEAVPQNLVERWDLIRKKPVALANQMVWHALAGTFSTDEEILPVSFRLRPIVEANLRQFLHQMDEGSGCEFVQFITREQLAGALRETAIDVDLTYEHLRSRLQQGFEQFAMAGLQLIPVLKRISQVLRERDGQRPVLLIDDLVQSLNIFATDLLDYALTLEEGEWEIVLGLTPAAFEWDGRGRELLERLRELDTVDDRICRLDLSDTTGDQSSFITLEALDEFLTPYITAFKADAGFTCGPACAHWEDCLAMNEQVGGSPHLAPLTPTVLRRMWHSLPPGKGRPRYMLQAVRRALEVMAHPSPSNLELLADQLNTDVYVAHNDPNVQRLFAVYGEAMKAASLPTALWETWGVPSAQDVEIVSLRVEDRQFSSVGADLSVMQEDGSGIRMPDSPQDPGKAAVAAWLAGAEPNVELLRPLRQGVARLLTELVDPALLLGHQHAQPRGAIRWLTQVAGTPLPISLEGASSDHPLKLSRSVGPAAFRLTELAGLSAGRRSEAIAWLVENPAVQRLLLEAEDLRTTWSERLTAQVGMDPTVLVFHLYRSALALGAPLPVPACLVEEVPSHAPDSGLWDSALLTRLAALWDDAFRIREHLYDGLLLRQYCNCFRGSEDSLNAIRHMNFEGVDLHWNVLGQSLCQLLQIHSEIVNTLERMYAEGDGAREKLLFRVARQCVDGRVRRAVRRWESRAVTLFASRHWLRQIPFPDEAPQQALEDLRILMATEGEGGVVAACRRGAHGARLRASAWFDQVTTWWQGWEEVLASLGDVDNPEDYLLEGPVALMRLVLDRSDRLERNRRLQVDREEIQAHRGSAHYQRWRRLVSSLRFLLGEGHWPEVFGEVRVLHDRICDQMATVEAWTNAMASKAGRPALVYISPGNERVMTVALRSATSWRRSQLALLETLPGPGRRVHTHEARCFLEAIDRGDEPSRRLIAVWSRFLAYAEHLSERLVGARLPRELAEVLAALVSPGVAGVPCDTLLSPDTYQSLADQLPGLIRFLRLSVDQEGTVDGLLHLVDRQ